MIGKIVKQINNLRITQDNAARMYRVYDPDGRELYASANVQEIAIACQSCKTYLKPSCENVRQLPPREEKQQISKWELKERIKRSGLYDKEQLEELYKGIDKGLQIQWYSDRQYDGAQMRQLRLGLEQGIDIRHYANTIYSWDQMDEIRKGLMQKLPVHLYANAKFDSAQMEQIRIGLEKGIDISRYAIAGFDGMQIEEILKGIQSKVDIRKYAKIFLDSSQMEEIRLGLEKGVDISSYVERGMNDSDYIEDEVFDDGGIGTGYVDGFNVGAYAVRTLAKQGRLNR